MPRVSIIIPAYNSMRYLPETLDSALAQSFSDFEIVIVNDGRTDNIEEWFLGIQDSRVRQIRESLSLLTKQSLKQAVNTLHS